MAWYSGLLVFVHLSRLAQITKLQCTALRWRLSISARDTWFRFVLVLKRSVSRWATNHELMTDVPSCPMRCTTGEPDSTQWLVIKLNLRCFTFVLLLLTSMFFFLNSIFKWCTKSGIGYQDRWSPWSYLQGSLYAFVLTIHRCVPRNSSWRHWSFRCLLATPEILSNR